MSLHIGNISSRIRGDDLERVFRRFGRCRIQVKDRYGFAVYDYPASAEKALKALQGTRICGEALTLCWSNHQPHAAPKFASGGRSYKPPRRKYSAQENVGRRLGSSGQRDYEMDFKQADTGRIYGSSDSVDEPSSYHPNNVEVYSAERDHVSPNDHRMLGGAGKNHLEDDRWGEQIVDPSNENYLENGIEFDRYDPDHSAGIKELDEHQTMSSLAESPSIRNFEERTQNLGHRMSLVNCYLCGEMGHKMHSCPLKARGRMSRSSEKIGPGGNAVPLRFQESDKEPSTSRNRRRLLEQGDSPLLQGRRREPRDKKRNTSDYESLDNNHLEKTRVPASSSNSDHTSSRLQSPSRSLRSLPLSPSLSKLHSAASNKNSLSPSLRSPSCKPLKSHSISQSMSPTSLLLPLELKGPPLLPLNKTQIDPKDSVANAVDFSHNRNLFGVETLVRSGTGPSKSEQTSSTAQIEHGAMKDSSEKDSEHHHFVTEVSGEILESYVARVDGHDHIDVNLSPHHVNAPGDTKHDGLVGENILVLESDIFVRANAYNSERMSLEEICTVLKHYGLPYPEENKRDLPVGSYFGSARLWPWEIIYYRRLKKGPISAENYSRRVMQNQEFGIVDRFIRGSSGWGRI